MATAGQLRRRLKAHSLQIIASRIVGHRDVVVISKDDACAFEDSADRGIGLAHDLRLGPPYWGQHGRHVECRDLVHGAREQGAAVLRSELARPLVAGLGVDGRLLASAITSLATSSKSERSRSLSSRSLASIRSMPLAISARCSAASSARPSSRRQDMTRTPPATLPRHISERIWCGRRDSNPHSQRETDFLTTSAFAAASRRSWSGLSLRHGLSAEGAARPVSTPSLN